MFTLNSEKLKSRSSYWAERRSADQCELFWHGWKFGWELLPGQRTAGDRPLGVSEAPPVEESVLSWSNSSSLLPPEQTPLPSKPLPFPKLWALKMQPKKCTSVLFRYKEVLKYQRDTLFSLSKTVFILVSFVIEKLFLANLQLANGMIGTIWLVVLLESPLQSLVQKSVNIQMYLLNFLIKKSKC